MKKKINKYETPVILPLGELARGSGAPPTSGQACRDGNVANQNCRGGTGVKAKPNCGGGSNATSTCASGVGVL